MEAFTVFIFYNLHEHVNLSFSKTVSCSSATVIIIMKGTCSACIQNHS